MGAVRWMEGNHAKERAGTNGNVRILLSLYIPYWMLSLLLLVYQLWMWSTEQCTNYVNRCKNSLSLYIACYEEFRNMLVSFIQGCYIVYLTFFWFNRELEDEETTDETRAEEREWEESDNDSSSGNDCDFEYPSCFMQYTSYMRTCVIMNKKSCNDCIRAFHTTSVYLITPSVYNMYTETSTGV